jgi:hypothetical protein
MTGLFGQNTPQPGSEDRANLGKAFVGRHALWRQGVWGGENVVHETARNQQ